MVWQHLALMLLHGGKALLDWGSKLQTQHTALPKGSSGTPGFEEHMQYLAEKTRIRLTVLKPHRATFEPCFKGRSFMTVLVPQGPSMSVGMFSNVRFPLRRIPRPVCDRVHDLSDPSDGFRLLPFDAPDGSFVIADGSGSTAELTPDAFIRYTQEMMLLLALVDDWIYESGYAP